jgi:plastocyanin
LSAASVALGGLVLGGLVAAGSAAIFSNGDSGVAGPQTLPGEGVTTVVAKNLNFQQRAVRVAAGTEVTLTMDNEDTGIPHNIEFFQSSTPGEGGFLSGCTAGCADDGAEVRTAVAAGPEVQEFTFTAPAAGRYAFWCAVHPTTMRGVLYVD